MIAGYMYCHYGTDYLEYALRSIEPYVERHIIFYYSRPSFGSHTNLACPDKRDHLYAIAKAVLGNKLMWCQDVPQGPLEALMLLPDTKLLFNTDADEIWRPSLLESAISAFERGDLERGGIKVPMLHHWRSFDHVCQDDSWSTRIYCYNEKRSNQNGYPFALPVEDNCIHHFGYARGVTDTIYKMETSAHKGEWRPEWFNTVWKPWTPENGPFSDVHPVVKNLWNVKPYNKADLPSCMKSHPYYGAVIIA